jgi:membrane protein implicated in regulation of membrane protease activity
MFNAFYIWLLIFVASLAIELGTNALVSIWISIGAGCAMIANKFGCNETVQIIVFVAVTALSFLFIYRWAKDKILKPGKRLKTNVEKYIGIKVLCTKEINNMLGTGEVIANGVPWSAVSVDDSVIETNEICMVVDVIGSKLQVRDVHQSVGVTDRIINADAYTVKESAAEAKRLEKEAEEAAEKAAEEAAETEK